MAGVSGMLTVVPSASLMGRPECAVQRRKGFRSRCIGMAIGIKAIATGELSLTLLAISGKSGKVPAAAEVMKLSVLADR